MSLHGIGHTFENSSLAFVIGLCRSPQLSLVNLQLGKLPGDKLNLVVKSVEVVIVYVESPGMHIQTDVHILGIGLQLANVRLVVFKARVHHLKIIGVVHKSTVHTLEVLLVIFQSGVHISQVICVIFQTRMYHM